MSPLPPRATPDPELADRVAHLVLLSLVLKLLYMAGANAGPFHRSPGGTYLATRDLLVSLGCHLALFLALLGAVHRVSRPRVAAAGLHLLVLGGAYLDLCFSRFHGQHLSLSQLSLVNEGLAAADTLLGYLRPGDVLLFLDLPALLLLCLLAPPRTRPRLRRSGSAAALLLLGVSVFLTFRCAGPDLLARPYNRRYSYPVVWMADALLNLRPRAVFPRTPFPAPLPPSEDPTAPAGTRPCLLLLQVESLEVGSPEWVHRGRRVMPFLGGLTREAVYFPEALSTRMRGMSFDADVGILGGFHPPPSSDPYGYAFGAPPYLPGLLARAGYRSVTFDAYLPEFYRGLENHRRLGIEDYRSVRDRTWSTRLSKLSYDGPGDREFLGWVGDSLPALEGPWLAYVKTLSSHGPFHGAVDEVEIVRTIGRPFPGDDPLDGYAATLRYVDRSLEDFLTPLLPAVRRRELVVAVFGDHGAGMGIGRAGTATMGPAEASRRLVPMLLLGTQAAPTVRTDPASLLDLPPTLCHLAGAPYSPGDLAGRDLLGRGTARVLTPEGVFSGAGRRSPHRTEEDLLAYGYGKLGAPR